MSQDLNRQTSDISEKSVLSATMRTELQGTTVVIEKEFRSKKSHTGQITKLMKINDAEFVTSSDDQAFKIWDKDLQGCRYTIETHEQLHCMAITGEYLNLLVSGHGEKNFIVIGLEQMNQNHISGINDPDAHDGKICQIITLSKYNNKYFATRCQYGDLGIWGSNKHPDRVIKIYNIDDPDYT